MGESLVWALALVAVLVAVAVLGYWLNRHNLRW